MGRKQPSVAKITRPTLPAVFPRERLFRLLDERLHGQVTWISGPPGSGKTTLVASYLENRELPCIWYQVDAGDADIATFFYYLGMAAKKAAPRTKKLLPLLTPEYLLDVPTFSRRYFEDLCARLRPPFYMVFDNYQEVPSESPVHESLRAGLSAVPEGIHLIIVSRTDPPKAFTGLLADSRLSQIGWDELRLTEEESGGISLLHYGERKNREVLHWMHDKTDGWAAGLILMAKALKREAVDPELLRMLAPEKIFDYFANELFDKIDAGIQDFLLKTVILSRMTPSIAERLTGVKEAGQILSDLNRRNYFTEKRLSRELSYQYHPLFREFLLMRVKRVLSPGDISRLQCTGAELLAESGQFEEAAALYIEAQGWKELVSLALTHARTLVAQGRAATLERWLFSVPQEITERTPWLLFWRAVCRQPFNPAESKRYFERAFRIFNSQDDTAGALLSWSSCVDTFLFEWNDFMPLDQWIKRLDGYLRSGLKFHAPEIEARVATSMAAALMIRQPQRPDIARWLTRALSLSRQLDDVNCRVQAYTFAVNYYFWIGDFTTLSSINEEIRALALSPDASPLVKITWSWLEAAADICVLGAPGQSLQRVSEALEIAGSTGVHVWDHMLFALGVYGALVQGDSAKAEGFLKSAGTTLDSRRRHGYCHYNFLKSWQSLLKGNLAQAAENARTALEVAEETGYVFPVILCSFEMAQVLHTQGMDRDAAVHLARAYKLSLRTRSRIFQHMCLLTQAWIAFDRGKEKTGLSTLRDAMKIGRENGYHAHLWWWNAPVMARLCEKALEAGIEAGYVQETIRKLNLISDTPPLHIETWPWDVKIYTLGRFELLKDDRPVRFSGKVQKKPLEMLKALIAFGGKDVSEEQIAGALWPEAEGDHAHKSFEMTLQRLRRILGRDEIVKLQGGLVSLDERYCWTDVRAFEHAAQRAETGVRNEISLKQKASGGPVRAAGSGRRSTARRKPHTGMPELLEKAIGLYQGPFLPSDARQPWSIAMRERLRSRFIRLTGAAGEMLEQAEEWAGAADLYEKGLEVDGLAEEFYQRLMLCYRRLGQEAQAVMVYHRCKSTLLRNFGIAPSSKTEAIYRQVLRARR